jgi:hypothetical protein
MGGQIWVCHGMRMAPAKYVGLLAKSVSRVLDGAPPWFITYVLHQHQADRQNERAGIQAHGLMQRQRGLVDSLSSSACRHAGAEWRSG